MLNVSAAILDNSFKTSTGFIDTVINETLWELLHFLSDYRLLQLFHRLQLSLVVDSLLNMNMNMNLFNHNNNSTDNYDIVQLNSCGCWIVRLGKPALKTIQ